MIINCLFHSKGIVAKQSCLSNTSMQAHATLNRQAVVVIDHVTMHTLLRLTIDKQI